jgi:DNA primase
MIKRDLNDVLSLLDKSKRTMDNRTTGAPRYIACCPIHEDTQPSLIVEDQQDGRLLFHCHVGCDHKAVETYVADRLPERNLTLGDLLKKNPYLSRRSQ